MRLREYAGALVLAAAVAAVAAAAAAGSAAAAEARNASHERPPSPETWGLRPDQQPTFQLNLPAGEPQGKQFDPRARDLNATALLARLGSHFDPRYMSVHRPPNASTTAFPFRHHKGGKHGGGAGGGGGGRLAPAPGAEMPPFLRRMNFRFLKLPNGTRLRTHVSQRLQKKLQHFLWAWTACPVTHAWRDLGARFWPRYVLEGSCRTARSSCSVPPGMKCAPSERVLKVILWWQCSPAGGGGGGGGGQAGAAASPPPVHCQWMEINNFPIVTGCSCGCPSQHGS